MRFVLASNNTAKTEEVAVLAQAMGHQVENYRNVLGETLVFPAETTTSQFENARVKAQFVHQYLPDEYVLSDDTGLYLSAFPDRFGVVTARELKAEGILGTEAEQQYILDLLRQPLIDRSGYLLAVMGLATPDNRLLTAQGKGGVRIAENSRRGDYIDGLDNIVEAENGLTLSEMSINDVIDYHDRSRALQALVNLL